MKFNYEDFRIKKDEIILKEEENKNLNKELETFNELFKISAVERKNHLSNMINDIVQTIKLNDVVIQENKKYINEEKSSIGKEIKEYLNIIREEVNDYTLGDNKGLSKLKICVNNIDESLREIKLYIDLIDDLAKDSGKNNNVEIVSTNKIENTLTGDSEFPNYIISKEYEFSAFLPNNKTGYSLKSFFSLHKSQIEEVLAKLNNDKIKTIKYFQKIHGLYGSAPINENTINALFSSIGLSVRKTRLGVKINNIEITGESDFEIFVNAIESIGIEKIYNGCKSIFDKSFTISKNLLNNMHCKPKEINQNNQIYYVYVHSSTEGKYAKLNSLRSILRNNFILYYK